MTDHPTTAARDLYAAILREPWDDAHRLVYADYLDEHPRDDNDRVRAEFIRRQIWSGEPIVCPPNAPSLYHERFGVDGRLGITIRRGFVDSVAMSLRQFMGGECRHRPQSLPRHLRCQDCNGSGRTPGLASVICAKWPVTEIRLTDREPYGNDDERRRTGTGIGWQRERITNMCWGPHNFQGIDGRIIRYGLPDALYDKLNGATARETSVDFESVADANNALSRAAVAYARELAGLPPLKWMTNANNPLLDGPADRPVHAGNRSNDRLAGSTLSQ